MISLEARKLAHTYRDGPRALDGVDFGLSQGELCVVIGPNGSGKSTLLQLLAGLLPVSEGEVRLQGRPIAQWPARERARHIAIVPQFLPALPDLLVSDFVLGGRYAHFQRWRQAVQHDHEVVAESLARCDASDIACRSMQEISGGQRQRVLFARALAQEADVLLVDEPTNSLDPEHQVRVFALLSDLVRGGRSAFVVTHDLNLASQFATRICLLSAGRVVSDGPVASVLRREVLEPVYGEHLYYGRFDDGRGGGLPFVLPWMEKRAGP
ncbi:MAG TPA: ABC transporter ATP-binding protein [Planctomycetota bacterium]|nr:ABC transporter ATP-binding protein [Planctomycetota bacterium]